MRAHFFLTGYVSVGIKGTDAAAVFELLRREQLSPKGIKRVKKTGDISFMLPLYLAGDFLRAARDAQITPLFVREGGVPLLWRRALRRPGLMVGILLGVALLVTSRLVVWEIRITGNDTIDERELVQELAAVGLARGSFLPTLERDGIALSLREGDARIAYASINLSGTVAHVQIREAEDSKAPLTGQPANLVARCDGVVTMPLIYEGECLVREGDVVRAGDLLAGGVIDTQNHGYRVTRAAGQVLARTVHTYTVHVPFSYQEKQYTGREKKELSLLFFNSVQKVFKNTGNYIDNCDIIEEIKWPTLHDGKRLPIGLAITSALEYEYVSAHRTAAEARTLAKEMLEQQLAKQSTTCTLLQKTTESIVDSEGITLVCTVVCEEDIAIVSEFMLEELYGTGNHQGGTQ